MSVSISIQKNNSRPFMKINPPIIGSSDSDPDTSSGIITVPKKTSVEDGLTPGTVLTRFIGDDWARRNNVLSSMDVIMKPLRKDLQTYARIGISNRTVMDFVETDSNVFPLRFYYEQDEFKGVTMVSGVCSPRYYRPISKIYHVDHLVMTIISARKTLLKRTSGKFLLCIGGRFLFDIILDYIIPSVSRVTTGKLFRLAYAARNSTMGVIYPAPDNTYSGNARWKCSLDVMETLRADIVQLLMSEGMDRNTSNKKANIIITLCFRNWLLSQGLRIRLSVTDMVHEFIGFCEEQGIGEDVIKFIRTILQLILLLPDDLQNISTIDLLAGDPDVIFEDENHKSYHEHSRSTSSPTHVYSLMSGSVTRTDNGLDFRRGYIHITYIHKTSNEDKMISYPMCHIHMEDYFIISETLVETISRRLAEIHIPMSHNNKARRQVKCVILTADDHWNTILMASTLRAKLGSIDVITTIGSVADEHSNMFFGISSSGLFIQPTEDSGGKYVIKTRHDENLSKYNVRTAPLDVTVIIDLDDNSNKSYIDPDDVVKSFIARHIPKANASYKTIQNGLICIGHNQSKQSPHSHIKRPSKVSDSHVSSKPGVRPIPKYVSSPEPNEEPSPRNWM